MAARPLSGKKPKDLGYTLRTLLSYMGRHKYLLLVVAVLVTVSALCNLLGTYMIRPVVNNLASGGMKALLKGVALTACIYLAGALSAWGYTQTMVKAAQKVLFDIRRDLFAHLQTLPLRFFDTRRHGDVMSYFTNDVDTISDALNNSFAMVIQSFIQVVGTLTMLFILNWRLTLVVAVCYIIMFLYIRFSGKRSKAYYRKQQASLGDLDGYIEEMVAGQKVVKVFNHEGENLQRFREKNEALRRSGTGAQAYAATMVPAVVSLSYINYAIVAALGGYMAMAGMTDVGSLASYLVFVRQAAMPINQFTQQSNFLLAALAGAERVFEAMDQPPEVDEGTVELVKEARGGWSWRKPDGTSVPLRGDVRFDHVTFGYDPGHPILKDISLFAKPGQKIAFVGSTGAGKTTITNLINRFYDVQKGTVTYDGIDVKDIKKDDLRRSLGMVLQDTHLFTGTIADNIRFGKLDATMEEVEKAARIANADSFIRRLPQGYDTMVTADGANLSQGQRQLLAIARAAVADPPVLILDEATSSIDTRTEALIEKGMDQLMEGRTVFVIAHRLSTVRNANAIMVLEQGQIVERGSHDDLLEQKGEYYQLYHGMFELS
ncbi:ABC transporter ATP-binding protein [Intestinimonas sp. HCP28S3_D6]|uniref:ABC transporter ATP-binding protein n=1 Tax=Intestinimonas sp. HCP28S3_D6 TaxID=3438942 RepID=UPI003F8A55DF